MSTVVVLNGTSSSGKSTIARAFQELAPRVFLNFSIDTILYALPQSALDRIKRGEDIADLRYSELVRAFYACVRQLLDLGHDLVIDHAIVSREHADLLLSATESHRMLLVAVDCPREVLREREAQRGDRTRGLAEHQFARVHSWLEYDLRVDTSVDSADAAAARIVEMLR
jgi:chloramphenicol 3-O phosphotransferase